MQITLIGLDALGLSLGLALQAVAPDIQVVGHDRERGRVKAATQAAAIDKGHWNLLSACDGSEMVVVNEPLGELETELRALAPELDAETVVLVLTAAQRPLQTLLAELQPRAAFVGGRLVAPRLMAGVEAAAEILREALLYIIAPAGTPADAITMVVRLGEAVGARPCFLDAAEHDGLAASTAQLPRLLALALMSALTSTDAPRDLNRVLDPALGSLGHGLPVSGELDELRANADNLLRWVAAYRAALDELSGWLKADDVTELRSAINSAQEALAGWGQPEEQQDPISDSAPLWRQMLLGRRRPKGRA